MICITSNQIIRLRNLIVGPRDGSCTPEMLCSPPLGVDVRPIATGIICTVIYIIALSTGERIWPPMVKGRCSLSS
jgi:hypothetical protein